MFAIVELIGCDPPSVSIVPSNWLVSEEKKLLSYWPSGSGDAALIKKRGVPNSKWPKYEVRILGKAGDKFFRLNMFISIFRLLEQFCI